MNAYSLDLRKRVVACVEKGYSHEDVERQFKFVIGTVSGRI